MATEQISKTEVTKRPVKAIIIFITIGILIVGAISLLIYRYYNNQALFSLYSESKSKPVATVETGEPDSASRDIQISQGISNETSNADFLGFGEPLKPESGKINTSITQPKQPEVPNSTKQTNGKVAGSTTTKKVTSKSDKWIPNDYKFGDITGDSHLVIRGDTLWEISEGKYGNGYVWRQVAKVNDVRYLWNGNPIIIPGEKLTLPKISGGEK